MKRSITINALNPQSFDKAIAKIATIEVNLQKQCIELCNELANYGIQMATLKANTDLADYVLFSKEVNIVEFGDVEGIMFGMNIGTVFGEGTGAGEINQILMLEYGSGKYADGFKIVDGVPVGRGTFPLQHHAFDPNGWWYKTWDGQYHHSYGEPAYHPMQAAYDLMQRQVNSSIRKIFTL